ncbi:MAG TPA: efflux transporter outer membrane subunit [Gemmatimonadales bacterium]|nr:efflux transporter outer membrane subunit [Gemmatimonadales bacterium]
MSAPARGVRTPGARTTAARAVGALVLGAAALVLGCAVGPSYHPVGVVPPDTHFGSGADTGATRAYFDSLAAARTADTVPLGPTPEPAVAPPGVAPPLTRAADSLAGAAWLDILRDTTLVRLVETAVRQNRDVQTAVQRIREFRAELGVARSPLFPEVSVNASASTNQVAVGAFPPTSFNALRVTGDLAWELDLWGRIRRGVEAARADLGVEEAAHRAVLLTLVSDVASSYLQLLELDQERTIAERTLASRRETLRLARSRFQQGVISELDVRQFEAEAAVPATTLATLERLRAQQAHQLSVLLGEAPAPIPRGGALNDAVAALVVPDSLPASLLARRPDIAEAERAYAAATARIGVAQAERLPTVSITSSYGSQSPNTSNLFTGQTEVYQVLGGVSLPLFTGGRISNQIEAARARAEQARAQYEQSVLVGLREAGDALAAIGSARDQAAAQATQVEALRRALALAAVRYRSGVASYLEVLDAQRSLFSAELGLSQAQLLQLTSAVQLYRAIGGAWNP